MILDRLKAYGLQVLCLALLALLLAQSLRLHAEQRAHGDLKTLVARQAQAQAQAHLVQMLFQKLIHRKLLKKMLIFSSF